MKNPNNAISIIIPTYKRSQFLKRLLSYYQNQSCPYPIIVADSSPEPNKLENESIVDSVRHSLHIDYKHYDSTIHYYRKMGLALEACHSKYSVICADDDFIIPKAMAECVKWLDDNPDYSVVHGRCVMAGYKNSDKISYYNYSQRKIDNKDPVLRFQEHFAHYTTTFYSVHRRSEQTYNFCLQFENVPDDRLGELLLSGLSLIQGKVMCLDELYMVRQFHPDQIAHLNVPWFKFLTSNDYSQKYTKFRDCLAEELVKITGLFLEKAEEVIDESFMAMLSRILARIPKPKSSYTSDKKWISRLDRPESDDSVKLQRILQWL